MDQTEQTFLASLPRECEPETGEHEDGPLSLRWSAEGVRLSVAAATTTLTAGQLGAVQLSRGARRDEARWLDRLMRRPDEPLSVVHVELRGRRGERLRLCAPCPEARLTDLASLAVDGPIVPLEVLEACVRTAIALGARAPRPVAGPPEAAARATYDADLVNANAEAMSAALREARRRLGERPRGRLSLAALHLRDAELIALLDDPRLARVTHLDLSDNPLTELTARALSEPARDLTFERVDLSRTEVDLRGALALALSPQPGRGERCAYSLRGAAVDDGRPLPGLLLELLDAGQAVVINGVVRLSGGGLDDDAVAALVRLEPPPGLRGVDLSRNALTRRGLAALLESARWSQGIEHLALSANRLDDASAERLAAHPHLDRLTLLDLSSNPITPQGALALAASSTLPAALDLRLSGPECLRGEPLVALIDRFTPLFEARSAYDVLDLNRQALGDAGARRLARCGWLGQLRAVELADNGIGLSGALALALAAQPHPGLTLQLAHNPFAGTSRAAQIVTEALARERVLLRESSAGVRTLTLRGDALDPGLIDALVAFGPRPPWRALTLAAAPLPAALVGALARAPWLDTLERLTIEGVALTPEALLTLLTSELSSLHTLRLTDCELDDAAAAALGRVAPRLATLEALDLSRNAIGADGAHALINAAGLASDLALCLDHNPCLGEGAVLAALFSRFKHLLERRLRGDTLDASDLGLGDESARWLLDVELPAHTRVIDLSRNGIGLAGALSLALGDGAAPGRRVIKLDGNPCDDGTATSRRLLDALAGRAELWRDEAAGAPGVGVDVDVASGGARALALTDIALDAAAIDALARLETLACDRLELDGVPLDAAALSALGRAAWAPRLTSLSLARCGLDDAALQPLSAGDWRRLTRLTLSDNAVTGAGLRALLAAQTLPALRAVDLARARVEAADALAIGLGEAARAARRAVDLRGNPGQVDSPIGALIARLLDPAAPALLEPDRAAFGLGGVALDDAALDLLCAAAWPCALRSLDLSGAALTAGCVASLASAPWFDALERLDLSEVALGDAGVTALLARAPAGLRELRLRGCGLSDASAGALSAAPGLGRLCLLDLRDNALSATAARGLLNSATLPRAARLELGGNPCLRGHHQLIHLAAPLGSYHRLWITRRALDLSGCDLDDAAARRLAASGWLEHTSTLDLRDNAIGLVGAWALAFAVGQPSPPAVDLRGNPCDGGALLAARLLAIASRQAPRVEAGRLSLSGLEVGDAAVARVADLDLPADVRELDLSRNPLSDGALARWLEAAPWLARLRALDLSRTAAGPRAIGALCRVVARLGALERLDLRATRLQPADVDALLGAPSLGARLVLDAELESPRARVHNLRDPALREPLIDGGVLSVGALSLDDAAVARLVRAPWIAELPALDLRGAQVGPLALDALLTSPHLRDLQRLDLRGAPLSAEDVDALIDARSLGAALVVDPHLESGRVRVHGLMCSQGLREHLIEDGHLDLRGLELDDAAIALLARAPWLEALTSLDLRGNCIGEAGAMALASSEHRRPSLRLALGGNPCMRGAGIARLLARCEPLRVLFWRGDGHLDLRGLGLDDGDARGLAEADWVAPARVLDLSNNAIGRAGARALARSPHLRRDLELRLDANPCLEEGDELIALIGRFASIRGRFLDEGALTLSARGIGAAGVARLLDCAWLSEVTHLDLSRNAIDAAAARALCQSARLRADVDLDLYGNPCMRSRALLDLIERSAGLRERHVIDDALDLSGCALDDDDARRLAAAPWGAQLRALDLSNNAIGADGAWALSLSEHLRADLDLSIDGNPCVETLAVTGLLKRFTGLLEDFAPGGVLDLARRGLDDASIHLLADAAWVAPLHALDLSHNHIGDGGAQALIASPHLRADVHLDLYGNPCMQGRSIIALLERFTTLRHGLLDDDGALNLRWKWIGNAGVRVLASASWIDEVTRLDLSLNEISDGGVEALTRLPCLPRLVDLDLSLNEISPRGVELLARCAALTRLRALDLSRTHLGDRGLRALADSPHLLSLERLRLQITDITAAGLRALADSPRLPRLSHLDLSGNGLTERDVAPLRRSPHRAALRAVLLDAPDAPTSPTSQAV